MKNFHDQCESLKLETFDPAAFEGNDKIPQELCNFVLALALIYNDCKNMTYAATLLKECKSAANPEKTAVWGTYAGTDRHLFRLMISAVHELFNLIKDHEDVLSHEFFVRVIKQHNPTSRESWVSLTLAAEVPFLGVEIG
jgi:hypothetical protein